MPRQALRCPHQKGAHTRFVLAPAPAAGSLDIGSDFGKT